MMKNLIRKLEALIKPLALSLFLLMIITTGFAQQKEQSVTPMIQQCTITGSSTVTYGQSYTYTISGCSASNWTVSCGTVQSHTSTSATILFNSPGCGSATISAVGSGAANKTVTINIPSLNGGTISNPSQSINYNTVPAAISATSASGGSCGGSYTYQWYSSTDGDTFNAISGATGQNYQPPALTVTTYYERQVYCSGASAYTTNSATVTVTIPPLSGGSISNSSQAINYNTVPAVINATVATGGSCGSYTYQWYSSADNVNFTTISGATSQNYQPPALSTTTYYKRQTSCSGSYAYTTNNATIIVTPPDLNYNFIRERNIMKAGITDSTTAANLTNPYDVAQTTQYFDGLGRPMQTVAMQQSPLQKDLVSFNVYDAFGREAVKYLPYAATTNDGYYKTTAAADQNTFNSAQFPGEQYYYSQTNYESSPLNRIDTAMAPGQSWIGSNRGVSQQYQVNQVSDSVRLWNIASAPGSIPTTTAAYAAGTLFKNITIDEAGHSVVEYKDMDGKVVLKKVQLAASPGTAHAGWLCTYYIYDDLNNLRFVIQPLAVQLINANWTITTAIANELCFRYEYDYRKRTIIKKIPGAGEAWMVYDARDRLVMSQDSSLRLLQKWMYIRYDDQNRPDSTGLITDPADYNNLAYHQNLASGSTSYPNVASYTSELLTQTYYDDYSWVSGTGTNLSSSMATNYSTNSNYFITGYNTSPTYSQPLTQFNITRGIVTGTKTKVIGSANQYLYAVNFYDDRGRTIQTQSVNYTGGIDTSMVQYSFNGKPLRSLLLQRKSGANAQSHEMLTKMTYDAGNRLLTLSKNIDNASSDQLIATNTYNELGQLQNKQLGNNIENLAYAYNIRGWLTSINQNYIAGSGSNYFAMELGYDKTASVAGTTSYLTPEYNGNISGTVWKSKGDGINRKYDFTYDNVNRLTAANFLQNTTGSTWDNSYVDFTTNNLSYDANGNILTMNQKGFTVGGSALIDQLTYTYQTNSNKLSIVNDAANNPVSQLGDFHYSGTKQAYDYSYDGNGNLILDNNKAISSIVYNYLNLPNTVTVTSKGTITYTYDASGNKLLKTTVDNTISPSKTTTTLYLGGAVYQNDTLQFFSHEEGRARWALHRYTNGTTGYGWEYDYFLKDHLGNTRMVLTQEKDTAKYMATMEAAYRNTENQLFYNIPQSSYPRSSVAGYPTDNTTVPNDSLARVNGSGQKVGPSIILKVMSGDVVDIAAKSYWTTNGNPPTNPSINDVLNSLANGIVTLTGGSKGTLAQLNTTSSPLYNALNSFITNNDPAITNKPKAYLNWILLDDQFNYVSSYPQSGAIPVSNFAAGTLGTPGYTGIPITKSGYLYIYVSNESQNWDVFFDNLTIQQRSGPITEETHYYPFGLTMAGISDKALNGTPENKYKYNKGSELQSKEFSDGSGLELYATNFRSLDPQLGRWWQIDPKPDYAQSMYSAMNNNPILYNDPLGDTNRIQNPSETDALRKAQIDALHQTQRNKRNAPPLFSFTAAFTKGTYSTSGKLLGLGFGYGASKNAQDLSGLRDNKSVKKKEKTFKNGMHAHVGPIGGEVSVESDKPASQNGNLPNSYVIEKDKALPFNTEVEKSDENGKPVYSGNRIEVVSIRLGWYYGVDISVNINLPSAITITPAPNVGVNVPDNTYVKKPDLRINN